MQRPDLSRYAARLGYRGPFEPTLDVLREIHLRHPCAIPFENLAALCGTAPSLTLPDIEQKLLCNRRGGWCFEHNLLLWSVLEASGFTVQGLAARVLWQQPSDARPGRTHMLLHIETPAGPHIVDVGFGGLTLTAPLALVADVEQDTPHGRFVLRRQGDVWRLDALLSGAAAPMYGFDLSPQEPVDYRYANWYLATHHESPFVDAVMLARPVEAGRHAYRNGEYTWRPLEGPPQSRRIASATELRRLIADVFEIDAPADLSDARLTTLLQNTDVTSPIAGNP